MSLVVRLRRPTGLCFPRVSGDEPGQNADTRTTGKFSPRERG